MLMITDLVILVRIALLVNCIAFTTCESYVDYCMKDKAMCDDDGVYKHIAVNSYEDFVIRDKLDDDYKQISKRPKLALKKTEKMLAKHPNRWEQVHF